jgi:uncharacterized protein YuzE
MNNVSSFNVVYDSDSDVLYISKRREPAARGIEDKDGIVWRYDGDGDLIGATVIDFYDHWFSRRALLADHLSKRFGISAPQAMVVLDHALEGRSG